MSTLNSSKTTSARRFLCHRGADQPMTAQNSLIHELEDALSQGSAERREKTLRRVTDLFVFGSSHFSGDHIAVFDGVFSHLVADIEQSARAALADRLAALPNAPPKVMRKLAFDDAIEVAGPVLAQSEQLDNVSLVENAKTKSQPHLLAITKRKVARRNGDRRAGRARRPGRGAERGAEFRRQVLGDRLRQACQTLRARRRAGAFRRLAAGNSKTSFSQAA